MGISPHRLRLSGGSLDQPDTPALTEAPAQ